MIYSNITNPESRPVLNRDDHALQTPNVPYRLSKTLVRYLLVGTSAQARSLRDTGPRGGQAEWAVIGKRIQL